MFFKFKFQMFDHPKFQLVFPLFQCNDKILQWQNFAITKFCIDIFEMEFNWIEWNQWNLYDLQLEFIFYFYYYHVL